MTTLAVVAAQTAPPESAAQLADAIDGHYNHLRSLRVEFTQSYDGMGMHRVERGTLLLAKGGRFHAGKMRWTYTQPAGKLFVFTGHYAYFYTPGQSEVQRVAAKQLEDLRSPLALLLGHAELDKQLNHPVMTRDGNGDWVLTGTPAGLEQRVARFSVAASAGGVIHRLVIEELDGSRNSFTFTDEEQNVPTPDGAFLFEAPPGTHIVDGMPPI